MLPKWWQDGAIATAAFATCLLGGALQVDDTVAAPSAAAYGVAAISSVLTLGRRRAPIATLATTTVCGMAVEPLGLLLTPLTIAPAVISAYSLAERAERRSAIAMLLPCAALLVVLAPFVEDDLSWEDASRLATVAASPLVAAIMGRSTRHRRAHLALAEERAVRAEEAQDSEARRKVAEERVRIARELHDLVAHQITLANAQANVAVHLIDTHPAQARASLGELVTTTRQALDELRATVGLLRNRDDGSVPAHPAPGLSQLPQLVESFRRAGLEVSIHEDGLANPLSPAVDLTAYRIVQEALTNVTKHAPVSRAEVQFRWNRETVTITVANDGLGARTPSEYPAGYGLIGMRERASAVGGHLSVDARNDGGFLVVADLPLPSTGDAPEQPAASENQ